MTGYFAYHAVPTNSRALDAFRYHVTDLWRRSLNDLIVINTDHCTWRSEMPNRSDLTNELI